MRQCAPGSNVPRMGESLAASDAVPRRSFDKLAAPGGAAVVFGVDRDGAVLRQLASSAAPAVFRPNQWLRVDQSGRVTIRAHKSEMGQGVRTSLPAIAAAELGADWQSVRIEHAEPGPDFDDMGTSGSSSVPDSWQMLRTAAAAARMTLIAAASKRWRVSAAECDTANGFVVHAATKRRASFGSLVADAARIRVPKDVVVRPNLPLIGTRLRRVDTPAIVRGRATYGIDVRVPNMRFAVLARPPVPRATIVRLDEAAARNVAGVLDVVRTPSGVAVVAKNTWAAIRGRDALAIEWSDAADASKSSRRFVRDLEAALDNGKVARREGDFASQMRTAARTLEATFYSPFQAHAAIEPLTCVADVRRDRCEIWVGTQNPNNVKSVAGKLLGIPEDTIVVHVTLIGGAFGRRIATDHAREAIELSRAINAPVQLVWTRDDEFAHDFYGAAQVNRLTAGLDANGNVVGWRHRVADYSLTMFGAFNPDYDPAKDGDPWGGFDTPYAFPSLDVTLGVLESPVATGAWRAVSYPAAVFARECFLDEVARAANRDPLDLRLSLIPSPGIQGSGERARPNGDRLRNVLRLAAERAGWGTPLTPRRDGRRWGRGLACNPYHRGAMVAQIADVSVGESDIRVHRIVTAIDVGRVIDRSGLEAQVEGGVGWALSALNTEITFEHEQAVQTSFAAFPVIRMRDMPTQEIAIVENTLGPFGAGESPVPAVFAAVGNAVFAATGKRLRTLPLRLTEA